MKKKIIAILATLALACAIGGCADFKDSKDSQSTTQSNGTETSQGGVSEQPETSEGLGESETPETSENGTASEAPETSESTTPPEKTHEYMDFTEAEKGLFEQYIGGVIPFVPNNEYYVEGYYDETGYEYGMNFYTLGNTNAEFDAYLQSYEKAGYTFMEEYEDEEYGDTWYCYQKGDIIVDLTYYYYDGENVLDVYVYSSLSKDWDEDWGDDWDDDWGDISGDIGGGAETNADIITNAGKGLPTSASGVYNVDFTKAEYVKKVTDQGYYLDGCPTSGSIKVLVIPVEFSDVTAASKGYTVSAINTAFNGAAGTTDYYSVSEYYSISSYGKLDLDFTVLTEWFKPKNTSAYYAKQTTDYDGQELFIGDQMIMDEALAYLESRMDLSAFDADGNSVIDAVVMINTLDIDENTDFQWAYRYWNMYVDDEGYYYEYDKVSANDYLWASYQFMLECYDDDGGTYYDNNAMNTYTYIHEFGHVLGADDYYDTAYVNSPLGGYDVMDSMLGDHNPFTKFNYGWLTNSRLVVAEKSVTLTLEAFSKNGDTIIIANNWDDDLGAYQEYYVVMYYTNSGLNSSDTAYFSDEGIVVYHVNASLYKEEYDGEIYYDIYNTNTSANDPNGYGTEDNLIEFVKSSSYEYVYGAGDSLSASVKDDQGNKLAYTFTVDSLGKDSATLTFIKN